ncbi:hypothetical protein P167DRAFT_538908 [Morchella conica CCBAS932]|uniref:Saccharopine dehydrogenase NADP binding domain-containing protein n=1 Tax=Morchella conica CCBAS932 TaxID=1392247 RepID=A0A3N4KKR3_9PEZI|nr:hypothetical protein P167DRAFT_538908 [Morchella conica CCBAS932]
MDIEGLVTPPPPPPKEGRKYDLIVFGASGYTGRLTCEQVLANTPSTLKWAIAGRSPNKLELLALEYNKRFPDRVPVGIFIANVENEDTLETMARVTRVLITTVGPYLKYGTPVLEACALNGTHYVDATVETTWVREMIKKYHKTATVNGAVIIPQCGVQSAPADLAAHSLVSLIRNRLSCPTDNITFTLLDHVSGVSGGTVETLLSVWEIATLQEMFHARRTYSLSPIKGLDLPFIPPIQQHEDLGILTKNVQASHDEKVVMRSWGLNQGGEWYGRNFMFREYRSVETMFMAVWMYIWMSMIQILPYVTPVRWIIRRYYAPPLGEGPILESTNKYRIEWRGVAEADDDNEEAAKATISILCEKDTYTTTGILLVQTAMSLLSDEETFAKKTGGGVLTPSAAASPAFFMALDRCGFHVETKMMEEF